MWPFGQPTLPVRLLTLAGNLSLAVSTFQKLAGNMGAMSRKTLSELMESRRLDLVMTWEEIAEATGITTETLRQIRGGAQRPRALTIRRLEAGFRWQPGSLAEYLAGRAAEPVAAAGTPGGQPGNVPPRLRRVLEELLADPDADEKLKDAARLRLQGHLPGREPGDGSSERSVG